MSTAAAAQRPRPAIRPPLAGPELFAWIALRRAHAGGVARVEGRYYDSGLRVPCFVDFDTLIEAGLLALAEPALTYPALRRVILTREGHTRFAELNERTGSPGPLPPVAHLL